MLISKAARCATAVCCFATLVTSQTIVVGNETLNANASTIAPAAAQVDGQLVLTEAIISNFTQLSLTSIGLFDFESSNGTSQTTKRATSSQCKTYPGDTLYPDAIVWDVFNLLLGGALIQDVPLSSVCYETWDNYDSALCEYITEQWANVSLHVASPSDVMYQLWEGSTCLPPEIETNGPSGCTLGGFPNYIVNATTVAHIQLAVNLARNLNLRLVIKNTGHDFQGRSVGGGALSIWTNLNKDIEFYESYTTPKGSYSGPAMKLGAGIQVEEMYIAAEKYGVTAVGGLCTTVGVTGGYLAGGGHGPMSASEGMGSDQVLSIEVVTADGRFVTADESQNTELFWALRGGGASSYGVTVSWTVKVSPKLSSASVVTFSITSGGNVTSETVWAAFGAYLESVPTYNAAGHYSYFIVTPVGEQVMFFMSGWFAPNATIADFQTITAPLFQRFDSMGLSVNATWSQYESYLPAWEALVDAEAVGSVVARSASRLIPKANLEDAKTLNSTLDAIKDLYSKADIALVGYGLTGSVGSNEDNAVNPAWRDAAVHLIYALTWTSDLTWDEVSALSVNFTAWAGVIRDVTPGSGAYASEADILEPDFQQSFYGSAKYERLYNFKQQIDPTGLFYAHKAVGSEDWYVTGQSEGLPTQNGRLCRV